METAEKPFSEQAALTDEEVLAEAIARPAVFAVLVERYEAAFLRRARAILGPREETADVVVETFTKIYLKAKTYRPQPGASFRSWAYKILTNTALTYYRRLRLIGERFVRAEDNPWPEAADRRSGQTETEAGVKDWVASVLVRMPAHLARILHLYFIEERSHQEIAAAEHLTLSAVKTRMHRAKKAFKKVSLSLD